MKDFRDSDIPKSVVGADIELGNFFLVDSDMATDTGPQASRLLLRHISGIPGNSSGVNANDPQDIGRKWLPNGSCCYIDLSHLEVCLPEVTNAYDFTAALHAQLRIAESARVQASMRLKAGVTLHVLACNSDGISNSWGSHLNFLVSKRCWDNIFNKRLHYLLWLASHHACSIILVGQGKVGSENGAPPANYQLSQRADFLETVTGSQTTYNRPILNSRSQPLCGVNTELARFHHIPCDVNLCHVANVLKVGVLQILLRMVECESEFIRPDLILDEPVSACHAFSHDPDLQVRQRNLIGVSLSALDLQRRFCDAAAAFVETGACDDGVPRAREILALWQETLDMLAARNWDAASRRLDWVLKRRFLEEVIRENPSLNWQSPEIQHLSLFFSSLDHEEGIYWSLENAGHVELVVSDRQIQRFIDEPPADTRAFTRANLLRTFGPERIVEVDWDRIRVRVGAIRGYFGATRTVNLDDPTQFTRAETGALFRLWRDKKIDADRVLKSIDPSTVLLPTYDPVYKNGARPNDMRGWTQQSATTGGNEPRS